MNKNLLLALCVAVAAPCLAQQKSQTRLLQKTINTTDFLDGSPESRSTSTSYAYDEKGWLATGSSSDGYQYAHEYELNADGYVVKHIICTSSANGSKRYTKTERTLNENNKPLKIVQYVKNGDADYYKSYEDLYEYDHNPNGVVIDRRSYERDGDLYDASVSFWAKNAGKYVIVSTGYNSEDAKVEVEVDRANMSFCEKSYMPSSSDGSKFYLLKARHVSFGSDAYVRDNYYLYYNEQGALVGADGTKNEIVTDPVTNLQTKTVNSVVVKDGAVAFEMNEKRTWLSPSAYLCERSGDSPKLCSVATDGSVVDEIELVKMLDGTFVAKAFDVDEYMKLYVFNDKYELMKILRNNYKNTGFEWSGAGVYCLEEKDGDNWKPVVNSSIYSISKYGAHTKLFTDEQGRIKEYMTYIPDGNESYYVSTIGYYTYSENSVTDVVCDVAKNPKSETDYVKDGNVVTKTEYWYSDGVKVPASKEVRETVEIGNIVDIKTTSYAYNSSTEQWDISSFNQSTTLADGTNTLTYYIIADDGTKVPDSKSVSKFGDNNSYCYYYKWDSTLDDWVGTTGYSEKVYVGKELVVNRPQNQLEHFYDPSSKPEFDRSSISIEKCTKQYAWNTDTQSWDVTSMEGYEVSDDGRTSTCSRNHKYGLTIFINEVDAEGRLIRYADKDFNNNNELNREVENRYEYDADGHLIRAFEDFLSGSYHYQNEFLYTYGSITTGIDNAHVSATGLGIDGRTLSIDGAWLMLYNVAGQCVAQGKGSVTAPTPGVYVLKSGNNTWKMMLK